MVISSSPFASGLSLPTLLPGDFPSLLWQPRKRVGERPPRFMSAQNLRMRPYLEVESLQIYLAKHLEMRSSWIWALKSMKGVPVRKAGDTDSEGKGM